MRGGETGIADAVEGGEVVSGLRVEPSIGRLLVFSAGVENMHEMLPVSHGRRIAIQMWFACEGMDPGWAAPQRAEWERQHGWGGVGDSQAQPAPPLSVELASARAWQWR